MQMYITCICLSVCFVCLLSVSKVTLNLDAVIFEGFSILEKCISVCVFIYY